MSAEITDAQEWVRLVVTDGPNHDQKFIFVPMDRAESITYFVPSRVEFDPDAIAAIREELEEFVRGRVVFSAKIVRGYGFRPDSSSDWEVRSSRTSVTKKLKKIEKKLNPVDEKVDKFAKLIARLKFENSSNTPDYVLAEYLISCLENFDRAVAQRNKALKEEIEERKRMIAARTEKAQATKKLKREQRKESER